MRLTILGVVEFMAVVNKISLIFIIIIFLILLAGNSFSASRLVNETFEDQNWNDSFNSTFNPDNVSIISFGSAHSGNFVARMYGGDLGAAFDYNITGANNTTYYIKYYQYFPSGSWNWSGISSTGLKQFRVQPDDGWPLFMFKESGTRTHCYFSDGGIDPRPSQWNEITPPSLGSWHKVEIIVKYSDTVGGFAWYVDDVLIAGDETWSYDTWPPGYNGTLTNLRICGGNGFGSAGTYYIDDVEIWDGIPDEESTSFYCDCSGGTGGAGTYEDPFKSLEDIEDYRDSPGFSYGDDIYFLEGSDCSGDTLVINWEGTGPSNPSVFGCFDNEDDFSCSGTRPKIRYNGGYGIFRIAQGMEYLRFEYLDFQDLNPSWQNTGSNGIATADDGDGGNQDGGYWTITNCNFTQFGHYALHLAQMGHHNVIADNTISDCGNGIYFIDEAGTTGSNYNYIARNTCSDLIGFNGIDGHCWGLQDVGYSIIEDNESTDAYNVHGGVWSFDSETSNHNVLRRNRTLRARGQDHQMTAENSPGGYGNLAYQNIFEESADESIDRPSIWWNNFSDARGNYSFNNTIFNAHYGGIGVRSTAGNTAAYITYMNNIVVTDALTSGQNELMWAEEAGTNNNITYDYNLYWSLGGDPTSYSLWQNPETTAARTWAQIQSDGYEENGVVGNPLFAEIIDFTLQSGSPAIDAGTFLTYITSTSGSGSTPSVNNIYILHGNLGILNASGASITGMEISLFDAVNGIQNREITSTYGSTITLNSSASWIYDAGHPTDPAYTTQIALRFTGSAPDIGAYEYPQAQAEQPKAIDGLILQ